MHNRPPSESFLKQFLEDEDVSCESVSGCGNDGATIVSAANSSANVCIPTTKGFTKRHM